jgi:hypothetical protein
MQAPPPTNPADTSGGVKTSAVNHSNMNNALKGGRRIQKGGDIAMCNTSYVNGPDGYGYVPPVGCIGPIASVQDQAAQQGLIIAAYTQAVAAANAQYDKP